MKLKGCSSTRCNTHNGHYCPECSHANYTGETVIAGRKYTWDFNARFGPLFACKELGKKDWNPHARHEVWARFEKWHKKFQKEVEKATK